MNFRRHGFSRTYRSPDPGDDGAGAPPADTSIASPDAGAAPAGADAGAAATAAQPEVSSKAASMLEAMFPTPAAVTPQPGETPEAAAQRARDEKGRFTANSQATPPAKPGEKPVAAQPQAKPAEQKPPEKPEHQMPDGLKPEAQQRFQTLVNTNKELSGKVAELEPIAHSARELQQTFHQNGVRRDQFEQAMQVVGAMNRGDLRGALRAIDEQRALIAMALGEPIPGADPLAKFPDLRQRVDALQLSEADAIELARTRTVTQTQAAQRQREEDQQQQVQQTQQVFRAGQLAVDKFCKQMMQSDMDYAVIEPLLLKQIQEGLLEGVPPQRYAAIVEKTYGLIKQTAGMTRSQVQTTTVLRPTGGESPRQTPKTMHEAMWGGAKA